jgi:hypothetical protein
MSRSNWPFACAGALVFAAFLHLGRSTSLGVPMKKCALELFMNCPNTATCYPPGHCNIDRDHKSGNTNGYPRCWTDPNETCTLDDTGCFFLKFDTDNGSCGGAFTVVYPLCYEECERT